MFSRKMAIAMQKMLSHESSGFSLDAKVKIQDWDKEGLERLIRYCARPPFKSENIRLNGAQGQACIPANFV